MRNKHHAAIDHIAWKLGTTAGGGCVKDNEEIEVQHESLDRPELVQDPCHQTTSIQDRSLSTWFEKLSKHDPDVPVKYKCNKCGANKKSDREFETYCLGYIPCPSLRRALRNYRKSRGQQKRNIWKDRLLALELCKLLWGPLNPEQLLPEYEDNRT